MTEKPTYEELEKRIQELEQEESVNKKAEEVLQMSKYYLSNIINAIGDPVFVKDDESRFILANDSLCKILGIERENIIGKTLGEALPDNQMKHFLKIDKLVLESGQDNSCEEILTGGDGNILTIVTRKTRYVDEQGKMFIVGTIRDITEHKQAEEALQKSEKRLAQVADAMIDLVYEWVVENNTLEWYGNLDEVLGYKPGEIERTIEGWASLIHPEDAEQLKDSVELHRTSTELIFETYRIRKADGAWVWWEDRGTPVLDENDKPIKWVGSCIDITKRKQVEATLAKHRDHLEELIEQRTEELTKSNISLTFEIKERKLAEERLVSLNKTLDQKVKKRTNELKILNEHLIYVEEKERNKIAADLHDTVIQTLGSSLSKIKNINESDDVDNAAMLSDVQDLIEQSLNEVRQLTYRLFPPVLKDFDIATAIAFLVEEINKEFHADIQYINTFDNSTDIDETKKITLYRAANELILNILKHSGVKKGKIELSKTQDTVLLKIEDNGIGFDTAIINENPFNGFGLFALSERCKSMGGNIKIKSIPGECTKAVLHIPLN